jgi:hypothetical protein
MIIVPPELDQAILIGGMFSIVATALEDAIHWLVPRTL